eukprot:jgi/Phyca11/17013/fgenesh1_pg.PHYCAscaffold_24_\
MRCKNDPTKMAEVLVSVKKSFDKRLLTAWCDFEWDVDVANVTDDFILAKIDEIIALREEVTAVVKYQARTAKEDEKELFKLILEKAFEQDRDFQRRKRSRGRDPNESKRKEKQTQSNANQPPAKYRKVEHGSKSIKKDISANNKQGQKKSAVKRDNTPPTGGCLKCKGDHWLVHCPTASSDEKKELLRKMHERRDNKRANDDA